MKFLAFLLCLQVCIVFSSKALGINSFITGRCENDREWFCNVEFDENFTPTCIYGLTCNDIYYNTCTDGQGSVTPTTKTTAFVQSGSIRVEVTCDPANVSLHAIYTGQLVRDFGLIISTEPYISSVIEPGNYILVSRDPITGQVVDSDLIMIP